MISVMLCRTPTCVDNVIITIYGKQLIIISGHNHVEPGQYMLSKNWLYKFIGRIVDSFTILTHNFSCMPCLANHMLFSWSG